MTEPLFRPEVMAARRRSWLGGVSLAQPLSLWLLTACAMAAAAAVVLFLAFGEYSRRSRVTGQLVPDLGLATVVAPVSGVITRSMPGEGEHVLRDGSLLVISVPRASPVGGDMTTGLRAGLQQQHDGIEQSYRSGSELLQAQMLGHREQLAIARREWGQLNAAIVTQREQVAIADATLARFRTLAAQRYVSDVQLKQQEQARLETVAGLQALQRQATAGLRNIQQIEQALRELPAQRSARSATRMRELAQWTEQRLQVEASGEILVKSPVSGLVASRLMETGQSVQAGQPLLTLLPAGSQLQAQLLVPSRAIGFIAPGDEVVLRYQAFPHQKFGHHRGKVLRISRSALSPGGVRALLGADGSQAGEPYYRVLVELSQQSVVAYGQAEPLRPGMLLEADILGERRKLYEWVLEPLYSLTGRL
ncbi:MAG: hemolysin D [Lysobacteraceae bacterium]|nr:MAG: hemolysin D [Xanthomonadaceae bacterium]